MEFGVDTHKKLHVVVALNERGRVRGRQTILNTPEGWVTALTWACGLSEERLWGTWEQWVVGQGVRSVPAQPQRRHRVRGEPAAHGPLAAAGTDPRQD